MDCQKDLMAAGRAYPKTCAACGLFDPCKQGYSPSWTTDNRVGNGPAVIVPPPDRSAPRPASPMTSQWIPVSERLPEKNEPVLVYSEKMARRIDVDRHTSKQWSHWGPIITHWMPLPDPPESK